MKFAAAFALAACSAGSAFAAGPNHQPVLLPIKAFYVASPSQTTYEEDAKDADNDKLTYVWTLTAGSCGAFAQIGSEPWVVWHRRSQIDEEWPLRVALPEEIQDGIGVFCGTRGRAALGLDVCLKSRVAKRAGVACLAAMKRLVSGVAQQRR